MAETDLVPPTADPPDEPGPIAGAPGGAEAPEPAGIEGGAAAPELADGTVVREPDPCANCGAEPSGPYCAGCGQRHPDGRMTLRGLWSDFVARAFNLDRGLLHTLARLAGGPGRVPADYVEGRRRRYTHPLSFYLLASALYLFSTGLLQDTIAENAGVTTDTFIQIDPDGETAADSSSVGMRIQVAARQLDGDDGGLVRRLSQIQRQIGTPFLVFFALFLVLPLRLLFGRRRNLAETAIFSLYVVGSATLVLAVVSPLVYAALPFTVATVVQSVGTLLAYAGIGAWGAVAFWQPGWATVAKGAGASLMALLVYSIVFGAVALLLLVGELLDAAGLTWGELLAS